MIINTPIDKGRAKTILRLAESRENTIKNLELKEIFATIIAENYYEVIKELGIVILLLDGKKAVGEYAHKNIFQYLRKKEVLTPWESELADDLRIKRNNSSYNGEEIPASYLISRKDPFLEIIKKLKKHIQSRL